jgi:DNA-binding NarL/FixJ family response regulator
MRLVRMSIRVLLADDSPAVRRGLMLLLDVAGDLEVVAAARNGAEAVELWEQLHPDVLLMDVSMPVLDGISAARRVLAEDPDARVLMLTAASDREKLPAAIDAGASGYLLKDVEPPRLFAAVRAAAA